LRFDELRDRIPTLQALAGEQKIERIERPDDVVPLLFQHSVYKSYPVSLLVKNKFSALTKWLDRLTTHDLAGVDVSGCESVDEWLDVLDAETPVKVAYSSGTAGSMSFLPRAQPRSSIASSVCGSIATRAPTRSPSTPRRRARTRSWSPPGASGPRPRSLP
jgi:hypothetical protein